MIGNSLNIIPNINRAQFYVLTCTRKVEHHFKLVRTKRKETRNLIYFLF